MFQKAQFQQLPEELVGPLRQTELIVRSYLQGLSFIVGDAGRDPKYIAEHLLSYVAQDLVQSAVAITSLAMEGMISVAKRELRFIIESSIKLSRFIAAIDAYFDYKHERQERLPRVQADRGANIRF